MIHSMSRASDSHEEASDYLNIDTSSYVQFHWCFRCSHYCCRGGGGEGEGPSRGVKVSLHIRGLLRVFTPPETPCETHGEQHSCDLSPPWR